MKKIALCAGHHPRSKGAINVRHDLNEFVEATKVNVHLERILTQFGYEVHMISGSLGSKIAQINSVKFDMALDNHFNADSDHIKDPKDLDDSRGRGAMVMYCSRASTYYDDEPKSVRRTQACVMADAFSSAIGNPDLGGRPGWYWGSSLDKKGKPTKKDYFLRKTKCPAFITEAGYIDNNGFAEEWLVSGRHEEIAMAIADGVFAVLEG